MTILFEVEDFTRQIYKATGSQDDDFVEVSDFSERSIKSQPLRMTILFKVEDFTRQIYKAMALRMTILLKSRTSAKDL
jgi:hypothetical protein